MISRSIKVAAPAKEHLPIPALETVAGACPNNKPKFNELREVALKKSRSLADDTNEKGRKHPIRTQRSVFV
jgi:hypothetical protein